jgi:hypothetical protein
MVAMNRVASNLTSHLSRKQLIGEMVPTVVPDWDAKPL